MRQYGRDTTLGVIQVDIKGKTIVITGAARGLGAAMARRLAAQGANLALCDLKRDSLDNTAADCRAAGAEVRRYAANVSVESDVEAFMDAVASDCGALDVLINNAGITRDGLLMKFKDGELLGRMPLEDWQAVLDVNLTGTFLCAREAAVRMARFGAGGVIINISSLSRVGNFGQSNYSATKAGVAALTVLWARELARHGIRTAAIAPGLINTEMVAAMKPEARDRLAAMVPAKRLGEPDEVAQTAQFILENDYISGRVIDLDGGLRW